MKTMNLPLFKGHWSRCKEWAIKFANLEYGNIVLDYGCGEQELRLKLTKKIYYNGYDIDKDLTDIKDYKLLHKIDVCFALGVLEHMEIKEIRELCINLKAKGCKKLITYYPTEYFFPSKVLRWIVGRDLHNNAEHIRKPEEIHREIIKYFRYKQDKRLMWSMWVVSYEK